MPVSEAELGEFQPYARLLSGSSGIVVLPMQVPPSPTRRLRLREFEIDLRAGEVYKHGHRIRLQGKPLHLLAALLERPGELVTREELRQKLWPADTFVDFDGSLNAAVNRLREALDDSAENPKFVETLPRRGYRLIAPVETVTTAEDLAEATPDDGAPAAQRIWSRRPAVVALLAVVCAALTGLVAYRTLGDDDPVETAAEGDRIMLGVLPLEDYGGDGEGAILTRALTDELITELGRKAPDRLGVIASASMRAYEDQGQPLDEIGRQLGIDYAVEGGVRRSPGGVRLTIRLVDVRSQAPVWMEDYDQELTEFVDVEWEAAQLISSALARQLLQVDEPIAERKTRVDSEAYKLYLKGRYFREQATEAGLRKGLEYFSKAIDRDGLYARAYAGLAGCHCLLGGHGLEIEPPHETLIRAERAARRALELDDSLAEAHAALGMISLKYRWDFPEAQRRFERAIQLNPSYAQAYLWHSLYYEVLGMKDRAIEYAAKARELDPLSIPGIVNLAHQYDRAHRYEEAMAALEEALELNPRSWAVHWALGDCHVAMGKLREGIVGLAEAVRLSEDNPAALASLGYAYGRSGLVGSASKVRERLEQLDATRYVSPVNKSIVALGMGDADAALAHLELGYQQRSRSMAWLNVDERFDPLRKDRRFQNLIAGIGVPPKP